MSKQSRQVKWQDRMKREGKCITCGKPKPEGKDMTYLRCPSCRELHTLRNLEWQANRSERLLKEQACQR